MAGLGSTLARESPNGTFCNWYLWKIDLNWGGSRPPDPPQDTSRGQNVSKIIKHQWKNKITCGHGCSLSQQEPELRQETINLVKEANINIIALPMCNLYLQDRTPKYTPHIRGVTDVYELKRYRIPVAFASDNCRDPFYGFGDHDGLEVLKESIRICHLDTPYDNWVSSINKVPAQLMNLPNLGNIGVGLNADLIIFKARYFSELFSRPQSDRQVMRKGKLIDTTLPEYSQLDDVIFSSQV